MDHYEDVNNIQGWFFEDKLRNVIRQDLLLDFLSLHGLRLGYKQDAEYYRESGSIYDYRMEFSTFIQMNRVRFIQKVLKEWLLRLSTIEQNLNQNNDQNLPYLIIRKPLVVNNQFYLPRPSSILLDWQTVPESVLKQKIVYIGNKCNLIDPNELYNDECEILNKISKNAFDLRFDRQTRLAMMIATPIIVSPILLCTEKKWACNPDFLIRSDLVPLLFDQVHEDLRKLAVDPAPKIGFKECHYVLMQVRFISLHFSSTTQIHSFVPRNIGNIKFYKTIALYQNLILNEVQGYRPRWALLTGRSSQWSRDDADFDTTSSEQQFDEEFITNQEEETEIADATEAIESTEMKEREEKTTAEPLEEIPNGQKNKFGEMQESSPYLENKWTKVYPVLHTAGTIDCREYPKEKFMIRAAYYIQEAIPWWNWIYGPEAWTIQLEGSCPTDKRLYPNMKNNESFPWYFTKKKLAKQYNEITQLWLCGYMFRSKCFKRNIYSLGHVDMIKTIPKIMKKRSKRRDIIIAILKQQNAQTLYPVGFTTGVSIGSIINSIDALADNHNISNSSNCHNNSIQSVQTPPHIISNIPNTSSDYNSYEFLSTLVYPTMLSNPKWKELKSKKVRWFFDFETTESLYEDFESFPTKTNKSFISMIGSLIRLPNGSFRYKCFVTNRLNLIEEQRIILEWFRDCELINQELGFPDMQNPADTAFIHWSQAEPKFLYTNRYSAKNRHLPHSLSWPRLPLVDLLDYVREEPLCVPGSYSFKLKSVAKALFKLNLIDVDWPSNSQCDQGLSAMIALFLCDLDAQRLNKSMQEIPLMKEIIDYNHIDCLSMLKILEYLEKFHMM